MSLSIKQECSYAGNDWWRWAVWLEGSAADLRAVREVVYTLHPTFPNPVRHVDTRENGFRLESAGWGEFELYAEILFKDGRKERRSHWLKLDYPAESSATPARRPARRGASPSSRATAPFRQPHEAAGETPPRRVFVSSSVADVTLARALREAFTRAGFAVLSTEDAATGMPWERFLAETLRQADVFIFVLSCRPSLWMSREIEAATRRKGARILPVITADDVQLPDELRRFSPFQVRGESDVQAIARVVEAAAGGGESAGGAAHVEPAPA
jgi:hypothetical protein